MERSQVYTRQSLKSSREARIFRAAGIFRDTAESFKDKAAQLPDSAPSVRLQRIASGLGEIVNSLERAATAVESGHQRTSAGSSTGIDLALLETTITRSFSQMPSRSKRRLATTISLGLLETVITNWLRQLPIGSRIGRQLHTLRAQVREKLAADLCVGGGLQATSASIENGSEHIASIPVREMAKRVPDLSVGGAA